jgi:hypothetical protein
MMRHYMLHDAISSPDQHFYEKIGPFNALFCLWVSCDPEAPQTCAGNQMMLNRVMRFYIPARFLRKAWPDQDDFLANGVLNGPIADAAQQRIAILLSLFGEAAFDRCRSFPRGEGHGPPTQIAVAGWWHRAAETHPELLVTQFDSWAPAFLFSPDLEVRKELVLTIRDLIGELERPRDRVMPSTQRPHPMQYGPQLLLTCLGMLPRAMALIKADFPPHSDAFFPVTAYRAVELLEAIWHLMSATHNTSHITEVESFFVDLLEFSQPYDPHIRAALRILGDSPWAASVIRPIPNGDNSFVNRASQLFEFLVPAVKHAGHIDSEKIAIFAASFSFASRTVIPNFSLVREFTEYLTELDPEAVLRVLDADFDRFAAQNLAMVTIVLEKSNAYRPLLDHLSVSDDFSIFNEDELWQRCLKFHSGPVIDPLGFFFNFQQARLTKTTRHMCFDVIDTLPFTEASLREKTCVTHCCLARKAALVMSLRTAREGHDLLIMARNSYKALSVLFDFLIQIHPTEFLSEPIARDILSKSHYTNPHPPFVLKGPPSPEPPVNKGGRIAWVWQLTSVRKLIAGPYIRYAKTVIPILGKEKVLGFMAGHLIEIERSIRFLIDVLGDLRENGLDPTDFEGLFEGMKIMAELKPEFDRELLQRFAELLQSPEISARYEFPRREELIGLVLKYLEPESS